MSSLNSLSLPWLYMYSNNNDSFVSQLIWNLNIGVNTEKLQKYNHVL